MIHEYPFTNFNEYNLDWCIARIRDLTEEWKATHEEWVGVKEEWAGYKAYIDNYFENLDVTQIVRDKLDDMASNGTLYAIMAPYFDNAVQEIYNTIPGVVAEWCSTNLTQDPATTIDASLSVRTAAAESKAVGDHLRMLINPANIEVAVFNDTGYYQTTSVGNTSSLALTTSTVLTGAIINVNPGDIITTYGTSSTGTSRRYMFLDSSNECLALSSSSAQSGFIRVCAPANAAKMVINLNKGSLYYAYRGDPAGLDASHILMTEGFVKESPIINGNVSSVNGNIIASTTSVVTKNLIRWDHILRARIEEGYTITPYGYASDGSFLGSYTGISGSVVDYANLTAMKTYYPTLAYVRLRIGTSSKPVQESTYASLYGKVQEIVAASNDIITLDDLKAFAEADGSFQNSFSIQVPYEGKDSNIIYTVVASYEQSGTTDIPTITFVTGSGLSKTIPYILGGKESPKMKEYRTVRYPGDTTAVTIQVVIPANVTVHIKAFSMAYDNEVCRPEGGLEVYGHRRIPSYPWDSLASAALAAKAGKVAMVEIPKRLSDGVWIFYHDDTLQYDDTYIRQADGNELPSIYSGTAWSSISYATAASWDWGVYFGDMFEGTKPMTMDEFFGLCAKTGMRPALSIHPFPNASQLGEIKALAEKHKVLNKLTVKCSQPNVQSAYNVFGNDIDKYVLDVSSGAQTASVINSAVNTMNNLAGCTARRTIELFRSTSYAAFTAGTPWDPFKIICDAGFNASVCYQNGAYDPTDPGVSHNTFSEEEIEFYIAHGVSEITEENNWSDGLNW